MDKTENLKRILLDISCVKRIVINNEQYIKLSDVNDLINGYIDKLINDIENINVRISRETETDSGEMNADMMRDIIIRKISNLTN